MVFAKIIREATSALRSRAKSEAANAGLEDMARLQALFAAGDYAEVERLARAITTRNPRNANAWKALGVTLFGQGRVAEALPPLQQAAALMPDDAEAQVNAGVALQQLDRNGEAEEFFRRGLRAAPNSAAIHLKLGDMFTRLGRPADGEASYRQALGLAAESIDAHRGLGIALMSQGRAMEAEASYRQALALHADNIEVNFELACALTNQNRFAEAEPLFRKTLALRPEHVEARHNLGSVLMGLDRVAEAEKSYRQVLQIQPGDAVAWNHLGLALWSLGRLVEAEASCRRAVELKSDYAQGYQNLATILTYMCDYRELVSLNDKALALDPDSRTIWEQRLYSFSYHPELTAAEIFKEFVRWGERFGKPLATFPTRDKTPSRRLRVGYVSPDFRRHTSRFFFWPLFANHDHNRFETYAYSNVRVEDEFTAEFKGAFDHWRNIRNVSDEDAAQTIRDDEIDILVDGCGHMLDERLGIFMLKPAPIQATWLGSAWTTGLKAVDYALQDGYVSPEGTLASEKIIRLPHFFAAYRPPEITAQVVPAPCVRNGYVTFGYSGRSERLNHRAFRVWGEILQKIPGARMILDYKTFADPATQAYFRKFMTQLGMDASRVTMRNSANIFEGLGDFDILLDSFPHSGGTMIFDALWMSVPTLTLAGRPPVGRIGTSLMLNLDLPRWVTQSEEEYAERACELAADPHALAQLRAGMRERMLASPLMDGPGFARAVEAAYHEMYTTWRKDNA
jgi:protein O-GlcNAc transferase